MITLYSIHIQEIIKKIFIFLFLLIPYHVFAEVPPVCDFGDIDGYFYHWEFSAENLDFDFILENNTSDAITDNISKYEIDWGDSSTTDGVKNKKFPLKHTYNTQGQFNLEIIITFLGKEYSYHYIVYNTKPKVETEIIKGDNGCTGQEFVFKLVNYENNPPATQYSWTFGDKVGNEKWDLEDIENNGKTITHTYNKSSCNAEGDVEHFAAGATPVLSVNGKILVGLGQMAQPIIISKNISLNLELQINDEDKIFIDSHTGCIDNTIFKFINKSDYGLNDFFCEATDDHEWTITKYEEGVATGDAIKKSDYKFISGDTDSTHDIEIVFLKTGTYKIAFHLANACSSYEKETGEISIYENKNTTTYTPHDYCFSENATVSFTTTEDPEIEAIQKTTYLWSSTAEAYEFAEGTNANSKDPKIKFRQPGRHKIHLEKTSLCGIEPYDYWVEVSDVPIVRINEPSGLKDGGHCGSYTFSATASFTDNGKKTFGIEDNVIDQYAWTFDNNGTITSSSDKEPGEVIFDKSGKSSISLKAHNSKCGWSVVNQIEFEIYEIPTPVINRANQACQEEEISYEAQPSSMFSYLWTFTDGATNGNKECKYTYPASGSFTDKLSITSNDGCTNSVEKTIEIIAQPTVNAGADRSICTSNISFEITDATAEDYSSLEWTTNGDGSFSEGTTLIPTYSLGTQDHTKSQIELILIASGNGTCGEKFDGKIINITPQPTINFNNTNGEICQYSSYDITNVVVENSISVEWSASEKGIFSDQNSANTNFTPDSDFSGTITLILSAFSDEYCPIEQKSFDLEVVKYPTVDAKEDARICEGEEVNLSGISSSSVIKWETSGDGVFTNENSLTGKYIPGPKDIEIGFVILQLKTLGDASCEASDLKKVYITKKPSVSAGADKSMCKTVSIYTIQAGSDADMANASNYLSLLWTSLGTGSFTNRTVLNATYTPSEKDLTDGSVELSIEAKPKGSCMEAATDKMTLTFIAPPEANIGSDITGCQATSINLTGNAKNHSSVLWTSSGEGIFSDANQLTTSYQPDPDETGNYTLQLTLQSIGSCKPVSDKKQLTLIGKVKAYAGADDEVCANGTYKLASEETGASTYSASKILWSSEGDGTFDNPKSINANYTPGENDITNKSVTLTLTAQPLNPCSEEYSDEMTLQITPAPTTIAGEDQAICQGERLALKGANATNYSSLQWETSSSTGYFENGTTLAAIYHPGEKDTGKYTLKLTAYGEGSCSYIEDELELNITPAPVVSLEDKARICEDGIYSITNAIAKYTSSYKWNTTGLGNLLNTDELTPTYESADSETGDINICLTVEGNGKCISKTACSTLSIIPHPFMDAGDDGEVCSDALYEMNVGTTTGQINAESWSSIEYLTSGDGFFTDQDGLKVSYVPGDDDKLNQEVDITIKAYAINPPCDKFAEDVMNLQITPAPIVNAGMDDVICQDDTYQLVTALEENTTALSWTSTAEGSFYNANILQAIYTPKTGKTGIIQLQLNGEGNGSCTDDSDEMSLQIIAIPKVNAGEDANICFNKNYELTTTVTNSSSTVNWITSGSGTFSDPTKLHPIYLPSEEDYEKGTVQLAITVQGLTPCLMNAKDELELNFTETPFISAGSDDETCEGTGTYIIKAKSDENLTGSEVKNVSSYIWETDGIGSLQNSNTLTPEYTPAANETGIIRFILKAEGYSNCENIEDEMELTIIPTPSPDFNIGTTCIENLVSFEDISNGGLFPIQLWFWDFGDGDTTSNQHPNHEFSEVKNYQVTLSVTNNKGCTSTTNKTASINPLPLIKFTHEEFVGINVSTKFENESFNAISYNWDFGDTSFSTEENPSHTFTTTGIYTIILEGESKNGCTSKDSSTIEVIGLPVSYFIKSLDGCGPLTVEFTNTSIGKFATYKWDFGNGTTSSEADVDPIVYAPGTLSDTIYTVSLTVENKAGKSIFSDIVTVKPLPVPQFEILPTAYGCSPVVRNIFNHSTGLPNSYSFDFGDNTTYEYVAKDIERPFEHTFTTDDIKTIFPITLTASNECGDRSITKKMTVFPNATVAVIKAEETTGCAPLTVAFENFSTGAGDYLESDWIFEDGKVEIRDTTGETVYHTFEKAGTYNVQLTVHDTCATDYTTLQIIVESAPEINFEINFNKLCELEEVNFLVSEETQNKFTNFTWNLGDGTIIKGTQIDHKYTTAKKYKIQLSAIYLENGCKKTANKEINISQKPDSEFDLSNNEGCEPFKVTFTNKSKNARFYQWNFKDGAKNTQENTEHTFPSGDFEISLVAESESGCLDTITAKVIVHPSPKAKFVFSKKTGCEIPFTLEVTNTTENKKLNSYAWDFDNGILSSQTDPINEIFTNYGQFSITLKAENKFLCTDSCTKKLSLYKTPNPDFKLLSKTTCEGEVIEFQDQSENSINSYWEFSDGFTTEGKSASHIFSDYGKYDLFLKSIGEGNCADSIYLKGIIQIYPTSYADFSWEDINTTPKGIEIQEGVTPPNNGYIQFTNLSREVTDEWITEQWYTYKWNFDDLTSSLEKSPIHKYNNNGYFQVKLYTESAYSCKDSISKTIEINLMSGLFVPNAFNPGNPNYQVASFLPKGIGLYTYHVEIIDNWGNLIWQSDKIEDGRPAEGWDGTKNGEILPQGVYIWKIRAVFKNGASWQGMNINGENHREGSVTLIQ